MLPDGMRRPLLATDVVRFVGEPVVAVVAEDRYVAADAADLVVVDYDPLPAVVDPEAAATDEVLLFPDARHQRRACGCSRPSGPTSAAARWWSACGWRTSA